ncbi:MogA/MoaB family molybdenum cofactor biosynthesis protein [Peptoniphilus catoniae]|uniref:MogA/MoaB family molybdenum cofactor biosynthesis protein n=1 Tax=Peptoniphilus catoniae TaxID=1660341 RepID=UPI0010FF0D17|nr:MogA/MoaB family molybdenum cofactor biosynthesis protein [Peptoniphilus catoniae]
MDYRFSVLTVSDRRSKNESEDLSGKKIIEIMEKLNYKLINYKVVPDEEDDIFNTLNVWCNEDKSDLILTTGGTGFSKRDVTPEATLRVIEKNCPGISEAMRRKSMEKTPYAMLSRQVAGICKNTLIINLPGSVKAVEENIEVVVPILFHAIDLIRDDKEKSQDHKFKTKDS